MDFRIALEILGDGFAGDVLDMEIRGRVPVHPETAQIR